MKYQITVVLLLVAAVAHAQDFYSAKFSPGANFGWYKLATFDLSGNGSCCNSVNVAFEVHYVNTNSFFDIQGSIRFRQHKPNSDVAEWRYIQTSRPGELVKLKKLNAFVYEMWGHSYTGHGHFSIELTVTKESSSLIVTTYSTAITVTDQGEADVQFAGNFHFPNGFVGIGTTTPGAQLDVAGLPNSPAIVLGKENLIGFRRNDGALVYGVGHTGGEFLLGRAPNLGPTAGTPIHIASGGTIIKFSQGPNERMRISNNGDVGIGTTTPDSKLTVKGTIHAEEVKVDLNVAGPDYVFGESYPLRSLEDTEAYIKENRHLPGIPTSAEMQQDGVNLLEMNMKLLEKIEELTLYQISLLKKMDAMEKELNEIKKREY